MFTTRFESIFYCVYSENLRSSQDFIKELKAIVPNMEIVTGMPTSKLIMRHPLPKLFLLDDMMSELKKNNYTQQLFTRDSRHENCSFIVATQNYFDASLVIRNNVNYKVIFNDPTSELVVRGISGQLKQKTAQSGSSFLAHCFEVFQHYFPQQKHPYLVVDSDYGSGNPETRFRTNVFPQNDTTLEISPIVFYKNLRL